MPKKKTASAKKETKKDRKDVLPEVTVGMKVVITGDRTFPNAGIIQRGTEGTVIAKNRNKYTVEFFEGASVVMERKDFITKQSLNALNIRRW